MGKPIINKINTFDAVNAYTVSFTYDRNQPYKNRIVIINSSTNTTILDETISNMKFNHIIAANTLTNGVSYTVQISVFDEDDMESTLSDKVFFTCYTTPTFEFSGLNKENTNNIQAASYTATITYSQTQSRALKAYQFYLYNAVNTELYKTELINYNVNSIIGYTYKGLENNTVYYIRCLGETVDGVSIDTGLIKLLTSYSVSNSYSVFQLQNYPHGGYIQGTTNIVSIEGITSDDISITDSVANMIGKSVTYTEGFLIDGNYVTAFKVKDPVNGEIIYKESNKIHDIKLYHYIYESQHYFKLVVNDGLNQYILYSDRITLASNTFVSIYIKQSGDLYQLDLLTE